MGPFKEAGCVVVVRFHACLHGDRRCHQSSEAESQHRFSPKRLLRIQIHLLSLQNMQVEGNEMRSRFE
ncbi:hypothetical protein MHYP_G00182840 [Metynnis hypsauchen]